MKVRYDAKHDMAYIRFSWKKPGGAIEIDEGVVLDTIADFHYQIADPGLP